MCRQVASGELNLEPHPRATKSESIFYQEHQVIQMPLKVWDTTFSSSPISFFFSFFLFSLWKIFYFIKITPYFGKILVMSLQNIASLLKGRDGEKIMPLLLLYLIIRLILLFFVPVPIFFYTFLVLIPLQSHRPPCSSLTHQTPPCCRNFVFTAHLA